ncbi:MAG: mechanosensitive ion channel [Gammaproteobacteria bacterium]|nr:mechanosensitive ion channel [Gammaproteobacteria bacterium]
MEELSTSLGTLWEAFTARGVTVLALQLLLMVIAGVAAFFIHRYSQKSLVERLKSSDISKTRSLLLKIGQRLAFPVSGLFAVLGGQLVFRLLGYETPLLDMLAKLLVALAIIRLIVYALRVGIAPGPGLKAWEKVISTSIWVIVALHLLGWLPVVETSLDQLALGTGEHRVSLLMAGKFVVLSALYLLLALWLAGVIEQWLKGSPHINISLRVGVSKISKVVLLTVAIIMALTEAGVNLASLTVFGGALGVGIGFGLQKIVSNFISGFILLGDRSIRPGDVISVGTNYGWVKELRARYIVVRNRDGVETLIPNENLVTTDVINWSYSDRRVRVRVPVQISYNDDPEQAMAVMEQAATANERVLKSPEPAVRLMEFADSGIALELRVWMTDPEVGVGNVRSDINLAIWHGFKAAGITIPYPQRDVHLRQVIEPEAI